MRDIGPPQALPSTGSSTTEGEVRGTTARRLAITDPLRLGLILVAVVIVVVGAASTGEFLTRDNLNGVLRSAAFTGIVAAGMTPMTLTGNFVSLASQQTAVGASMLLLYLILHGLTLALAIVIVIAAVVLLGVAQGLIVSAGLNPIVTTLAAGSIVFGLVTNLTGGQPIELPPADQIAWGSSSVLGIPIEVFVFLLFTAVATWFVRNTRTGREIVLTGANRRTAELSGISFRWTTVVAFAVFSISVGIVAVLYVAGFNQANAQSLGTLTIDATAALLLGGIAITGGSGSPWQAAAGALFISIITNVMVLRGLDPGQTQAVEGAIVAVVVVLLVTMQRRGRRW